MTVILALAAALALFGALELAGHRKGLDRRPHAVRNLLAAANLLVFAWVLPLGWLAGAFAASLLVEAALTTGDLVAEERRRALPRGERIAHVLTVAGYALLLVLVSPYLVGAATGSSGAAFVDRELWSPLLTLLALGIALWCQRDTRRARADASPAGPAAPLVTEHLPDPLRVLVTGGTGFIGRRLVMALAEAGHIVTVLTRDVRSARGLPATVLTDLDPLPNDARIDAVVNLAGASVAGGRWTARRKAVLRASRIDTTRAVVRLLGRLERKPGVLVSASATGFYGADSDMPLTEASRARPGFAHDLCATRETEARKASRYGVRVVELRFGLVLAPHGGPLGALRPAFAAGLGVRLGSGRQWMSWIALDDAVRAITFAIGRDDLRGPFNAVAPHPVRNDTFTRALAAALHRPRLAVVPAWAIRLVLGEMGRELLLASHRVLPMRLEEAGFRFAAPTLSQAFASFFPARRVSSREIPGRGFRSLP